LLRCRYVQYLANIRDWTDMDHSGFRPGLRRHLAGELTPVWVPDQALEAIRDLVRSRMAAARALRQARQQLRGFLLRHGRHHARSVRTLMHRRWLAGLTF
jgi:transposase